MLIWGKIYDRFRLRTERSVCCRRRYWSYRSVLYLREPSGICSVTDSLKKTPDFLKLPSFGMLSSRLNLTPPRGSWWKSPVVVSRMISVFMNTVEIAQQSIYSLPQSSLQYSVRRQRNQSKLWNVCSYSSSSSRETATKIDCVLKEILT